MYELHSHGPLYTTGNRYPGGELRIERTGSVINYKVNGNTIYTSTVPSSGTLIADCALYDNGAEINDAWIVGATTPPSEPPDAVTDLSAECRNRGSDVKLERAVE